MRQVKGMVELAKESHAQRERQKTRESDGRYADMTKCEICGKGVGNNYCSDERVDEKFQGLGLTLCLKDGKMLANLPDEEALRLLKEAEEKRKGNSA
jgi:hypothetical protein